MAVACLETCSAAVACSAACSKWTPLCTEPWPGLDSTAETETVAPKTMVTLLLVTQSLEARGVAPLKVGQLDGGSLRHGSCA